jgi:prolyl-tRNA synthetase
MVPFPDDEAKHHDAVLEGDAECAVCGDDADETAFFAKSY